MKCIIADDERLVRFSIQDMLEEIADAGLLWFEEIRQAVDGQDLLRQIALARPDLVFVDIRMPLLSGLDAIERGRSLSPNTQWIILTGYAEFDYAKRAIALGAMDYLLKPASRADIERVVRLALSNFVDRRAQEQLWMEHRMLGLLQDTFSEDPELSTEAAYTGLVLILDTPCELRQASVLQHRTLHDTRQWLRAGPQVASPAGMAVLDDGNLICVLSSTPTDAGLEPECREVAERMVAASSGGADAGIARTVLLLDRVEPSLTAVLRSLDQLSRDASLRLAGGLGGIIDAPRRELLSRGFIAERALLASLDKAVRNRELEPTALLQLLKQNRSRLEGLWGGSSLREYLAAQGALGNDAHDPAAALDSCIAWCADGLLPVAPDHESDRRRRLVRRALDIIAEQYTKEIGLAQVADMLGITPNYLSSEFNRVMGESFSQYVTRLRMKEADALIRGGGLTVKEVASRVGYVSSRHFAALFKKNFGHVPSEHPGTEQARV
jgi:two-component system response regulator YesN